MTVSVFIPSHITGFFSINNNKNSLKKGSCGTGVLIDKGVTTKIKVESSIDNENVKNNKNNNKLDILINGKKDLKNEKITLKTMQIMEKQLSSNIEEKIAISHNIEVPLGAGFGTSASCALGTAIGVSKYFDLELSIEKMGQIAHLAEISLGSGLGDVLSQTSTGIVIRKSPGAPGIGKTQQIIQSNSQQTTNKNKNNEKNEVQKLNTNEITKIDDFIVLTKTFGEIDTSNIIQDPNHAENINKIGSIMQEKIMKSPTIENFMDYSYQFAIETNLMSKDVLAIIKNLKQFSIKGAMAMLGNTAFAITTKKKFNSIEKNSEIDNINISDFEISKIDTKGIRIF